MSGTQSEPKGKIPQEVVNEFVAAYSVESVEALLMEVFKRYSLGGPEDQKGVSGTDEKVAIFFDDLVFLVEALHGFNDTDDLSH